MNLLAVELPASRPAMAFERKAPELLDFRFGIRLRRELLQVVSDEFIQTGPSGLSHPSGLLNETIVNGEGQIHGTPPINTLYVYTGTRTSSEPRHVYHCRRER